MHSFLPIKTSQNNVFTYGIAIPYTGDSVTVEVFDSHKRPMLDPIGWVEFKHRLLPVVENKTIKITAANGYEESSYRLDVDSNLEALVWARSATWTLPTLVPDLLRSEYAGPMQCIVTRPNSSSYIEESAVECLQPMSTSTAFVYLSMSRPGEAPGLYARVRRTAAGPAHAYVIRSNAKSFADALSNMRTQVMSVTGSAASPRAHELASPFQGLMFCTWSSVGEHVRLNNENMNQLLNSLHGILLSSFLIDDGWQNVRIAKNGTRTLYNFKARNELQSLSNVVQLIKKKQPTVKDVGVWMTLSGYWNGIANTSPLIEKYDMKQYALSRQVLPRVQQSKEGPTTHSADFEDSELRTWWIPAPSHAYQFWRDYFEELHASGVTFVKVDNQAYGEFLEGYDGLQAYIALQDGMLQAASDVFGPGRVLNCMSHSMRLRGGDIGQRLLQDNQQLVVRASMDYDRDQSHGMHVAQNLLNGHLFESFNITTDADMFRTTGHAAEMHAILRALMPGPVMIADKPGSHNPEIVERLVAQNSAGESATVHMSRAPNVVDPWQNNGTVSTVTPSSEGVGWTVGVFNIGTVKEAHFVEQSFPDTCVFSGSKASWDNGKFAIQTVLDGESAAVYTATNVYNLHETKVSCVGLTDKYAALAGIVSVQQVNENTLRVECSLSGRLGFAIESSGVTILIDDNTPIKAAVLSHAITGGELYTVDLVPYSGATDNWIVTLTVT